MSDDKSTRTHAARTHERIQHLAVINPMCFVMKRYGFVPVPFTVSSTFAIISFKRIARVAQNILIESFFLSSDRIIAVDTEL